MNKTMKLLTVIFVVAIMIFTSASTVFASDTTNQIINSIETNKNANMGDAVNSASGITALAGKVIGLIQIASAIAAVILVAVFGFKFIMGSAEQKSDYQKSFIPLIVGVIVVFSATSIAKLLFGLLK